MGSAYSMNTSAFLRADAGKGRILVVEDDRTFGEALCQVLDREGYDATLATDFQTALGILEAEQPLDLMLVDIVMPDVLMALRCRGWHGCAGAT